MAGGLTKGKSHAKGGIKMKVKSTGQNIEVEGGEGIINKHTMSSKDKHTFEGKEMTACEIASKLNQKTGNGVSFDCDETKNTDMTPTDPTTGFAKGGKTKRKYKKKKMAKSKKKTGAFGKLVSKIMKRDGIPYKQALAKAKDEYVSGATSQKKQPKKSYKGRLDKLKSKSAPKKSYSGRPKKAQGGNIMQDISPNANDGDGDIMPDASSMVGYAKGGKTLGDGRFTKEEVLSKSIVYDNGGETLDRYTIYTPDGSVYGMSETGGGFNQYLGESNEIPKGKHLGKRLKSVPKDIQSAVVDRMTYAKGGKIDFREKDRYRNKIGEYNWDKISKEDLKENYEKLMREGKISKDFTYEEFKKLFTQQGAEVYAKGGMIRIESGNKGKTKVVFNKKKDAFTELQANKIYDEEKAKGKSVFLFVNDELYDSYIDDGDEDMYAKGGELMDADTQVDYAKGGKIDWESKSPKIYVASLSDYNAGRLEGEWFDFDHYEDEIDLMTAIEDMLDALNEKYKDGENREEWAVHDHEYTYGIIGEYSGEKDFEKVYALKEAVEESGLPFEVLTKRIQDTGQEVDEVGDDYYGAYDSEEDFADQLKDESGMSAEQASYYVYCDEVTARVVAGEEADQRAYGDYDDYDILEMTGMEDEYKEADYDDREEILDKAKEILHDEVYDEWYRGLRDDAVDFLVNEMGIYSEEDVVNLNWLSFDLERWTRDLMYDFTSYYNEEDGMYYIFNN